MKGERPPSQDARSDPRSRCWSCAGGWGRAALGGGGSGQPWDAGPAPISAPSSPCSAPRAGVLHPTRPRGARPPLPQWDPALRLRRLRQNLRPLREPGAAHARPLPGGHLAEHGAPVRPPALRSSQGAQGAPRATQMGGGPHYLPLPSGSPLPALQTPQSLVDPGGFTHTWPRWDFGAARGLRCSEMAPPSGRGRCAHL